MNAKGETDKRQEPIPAEDRDHDRARFGLRHLIACIASAILVVIAINVHNWL